MLSWTTILEVVVGRRRAGPRAIAAKARSAAAMSWRRVASRRASGVGEPAGSSARSSGCSASWERPPSCWMWLVLRYRTFRTGKRPLRLGQLARHLVGRHQGHDRVVAVVILAAERAGVGQRRRGDEPAEVGRPP